MICKDKKRGTWYVKYYAKNDKGQLVSTTKRGFLDKVSAKRFELEKSTCLPTTFFKMYCEFINSLNCSDEEKKTRISYCVNYIPFKDKKMESITKANLSHFTSDFKNYDKLSVTTKNRILGYIKSTYRYACDIYDMKDISNVINLYPNDKEEKEVLTLDEFNRMIEFEKNPIMYAFFYTAFWTGCRRGELKGLYKEDLIDHALEINHTMRLGEDSMKQGTKTSRLKKVVALDEDTYSLLLPLACREGKYLFGDEAPLSNETIRRHLKDILKQANIDKHITVHSLRHSHGSLLLANGVDIATVSKRLGHSNLTTTLNTYIHILDDDGKVVVGAIDKIKKTSD